MFETEKYIGQKQDPPAPVSAVRAGDNLPATPDLGDTSSQPSTPKSSTTSSFSSLFPVEACIRCVKLLNSNPNHHCHRVHQSRRCDPYMELDKPCRPILRPLWATVGRLLDSQMDPDFDKQVKRVVERLEAYGHAGKPHDETIHLLRSIIGTFFVLSTSRGLRLVWSNLVKMRWRLRKACEIVDGREARYSFLLGNKFEGRTMN